MKYTRVRNASNRYGRVAEIAGYVQTRRAPAPSYYATLLSLQLPYYTPRNTFFNNFITFPLSRKSSEPTCYNTRTEKSRAWPVRTAGSVFGIRLGFQSALTCQQTASGIVKPAWKQPKSYSHEKNARRNRIFDAIKLKKFRKMFRFAVGETVFKVSLPWISLRLSLVFKFNCLILWRSEKTVRKVGSDIIIYLLSRLARVFD